MYEFLPELLSLLAELRDLLGTLPDKPAKECWATVQLIELWLEGDPRCSDYERILVQGVKTGVSEILFAQQDGSDTNVSVATLPLAALETSVRNRIGGFAEGRVGSR